MSIVSDANKTINVANVSNSTITHDESITAVDQTFNTSAPNSVEVANETYDAPAVPLNESASCPGDKTFDANVEPSLNSTETLSGPGDKTFDHEDLTTINHDVESKRLSITLTDEKADSTIPEGSIEAANEVETANEVEASNEITPAEDEEVASQVIESPEHREPEYVPDVKLSVLDETQVVTTAETIAHEPRLEQERLESSTPVLPPSPVNVESSKFANAQFQESNDVEMKELEEFEESEDISMREEEPTYQNIDEMSSSRHSRSFTHSKRQTVDRQLKTHNSVDSNDVMSATEIGNIFTEKVEGSFDVQFKMPALPVFKQQLEVFNDGDFMSCGGSCKKTNVICVRTRKCIY